MPLDAATDNCWIRQSIVESPDMGIAYPLARPSGVEPEVRAPRSRSADRLPPLDHGRLMMIGPFGRDGSRFFLAR